MLKQQLRTGNILNSNILNLYQSLPRDHFVPRTYKQFAYSDLQIPLGHEQKMLTPLEEATILQSLDLRGDETVLEIGTGCGYMTALLAQCAKEVVSVDYYREFTELAEANLNRFNIDNVVLYTGDGHRGWIEKAPYDVIVVTGSLPELDQIFKPQLMKGGKLFAIIGSDAAMKGTLFQLDSNDVWQQKVLFETSANCLIGAEHQSNFTF